VRDVSGLDRPGPTELDQLARLRLAAARDGHPLVLRGAGERLRLLLELTGLAELLPTEAQADGPSGGHALGGEPLGQPP
jgi:anti-anti-sigma regulatory factor